jgi:hypothetical protein
VAVAAVLLGLVFLLTRLVVTDRQQLERSLWAMAQGVTEGKPDEVFKHVAKTFHYAGMDRAEFLARADRAIRRRHVTDLYLWRFDPEELDREGKKARVAFNMRVTSDWTDGTQIFLVRADFVLEDGQWRMKTFKIYNPVVNTDQPIPVPF